MRHLIAGVMQIGGVLGAGANGPVTDGIVDELLFLNRPKCFPQAVEVVIKMGKFGTVSHCRFPVPPLVKERIRVRGKWVSVC